MTGSVEFEFASSFDETTCEKYVKSTKKKARGVCKSCGLPKVQHMLAIADDDEEDEDDDDMNSVILLTQVFCDLRNLRMCVTNFFGWSANEVNVFLPRLISLLTDSLFAIEDVTDVIDMEQLIEAGQELVGYFEPSTEDDNLIEYVNVVVLFSYTIMN
jgi:hypothetical protein